MTKFAFTLNGVTTIMTEKALLKKSINKSFRDVIGYNSMIEYIERVKQGETISRTCIIVKSNTRYDYTITLAQ